MIKKDLISSKQLFIIDDENTNSPGYETNNIAKNFFNASFKNVIFRAIARPTRTTTDSLTAAEHILTNAIFFYKCFIWYFENRYC